MKEIKEKDWQAISVQNEIHKAAHDIISKKRFEKRQQVDTKRRMDSCSNSCCAPVDGLNETISGYQEPRNKPSIEMKRF